MCAAHSASRPRTTRRPASGPWRSRHDGALILVAIALVVEDHPVAGGAELVGARGVREERGERPAVALAVQHRQPGAPPRVEALGRDACAARRPPRGAGNRRRRRAGLRSRGAPAAPRAAPRRAPAAAARAGASSAPSMPARASRTARTRRWRRSPGTRASRPSWAASSSSSSVSRWSSACTRRASSSPIPGTVVKRSSGEIWPSSRSSIPSRPVCTSSAIAAARLLPMLRQPVEARDALLLQDLGDPPRALRTVLRAGSIRPHAVGILALRLEQIGDAFERVGHVLVVGRAQRRRRGSCREARGNDAAVRAPAAHFEARGVGFPLARGCYHAGAAPADGGSRSRAESRSRDPEASPRWRSSSARGSAIPTASATRSPSSGASPSRATTWSTTARSCITTSTRRCWWAAPPRRASGAAACSSRS